MVRVGNGVTKLVTPQVMFVQRADNSIQQIHVSRYPVDKMCWLEYILFTGK